VTYDARVDEGGDSSRRRYDSPVRRLRAAESRARIISGAAELARELPSWDWGSLTIQAVADQAGVSRRTVYRHFASEAALHAALADRLLDDAGVSYEGLALDDLPEVTGRVYSAIAKFAVTPWAVVPTAFPVLDADRFAGIRSAVDSEAPDWADADRLRTSAALDVVWSVASYEILLRDWKLPPDEALKVQRWLHSLVTGALRAGDSTP
jgi:AcrR family transcriptional regulator